MVVKGSPIKPPMPIKVKDLTNFARLVLALTDGNQIIWSITRGSKRYLAFFTAYMYWNGDLPILAYVDVSGEDGVKPFLAYRSDSSAGEEMKFLGGMDDPKYKYASLIELEECPEPFLKALEGKPEVPHPPLRVLVKDGRSIMRLLLAITLREGTNFPIWHFERKGSTVMGTFIPFEHYYESDALPMFIYFKSRVPPGGGFLKYQTLETRDEQLTFSNNTRDVKYFYAKIVSVEELPFI
ncbi:MAG: hypothetical protein QXR65_02495 [Candidatus Bathyarchaeia archaeon]|nr:hypothetical protein [Candidatus Bathyarchaeota archaeon]